MYFVNFVSAVEMSFVGVQYYLHSLTMQTIVIIIIIIISIMTSFSKQTTEKLYTNACFQLG